MNAPQTAMPSRPAGTVEVPFVRLDAADAALSAEIFAAIERVAAVAAFTMGDELEAFEREFASWCETDHAVGVSSGTSALELALRGLDIGPGDEVVVPTNSFIATAEAVTACGATPVLVDVDPDTALLTAEMVEAALTERTRCVIPVHLYGRSVEMDPLLELCRSRDLKVVEDACQAHGSRYRGRPAGTHGDAGCFSFYPTKNLGAWGDGGAVVTADPELAARIRLMRSHGEGTRHHHQMAAGTHRLHSLQAAILGVKLKRLDEWNENRRRAGARSERSPRRLRPRPPRPGRRRRRPRLPPLRRPHPRARRPPRPPRPQRRRQRDPLPHSDPPAACLRRRRRQTG